MRTTGKNTQREVGLQRWNLALATLAWLGIGSTLIAILGALFGPSFQFGLFTVDGVQALTEKDFNFHQRFITVAILSVPQWCWVWSMVQVLRMSRYFGRGELLTRGVVDCLTGFGWGLLALVIAELAVIPAANAYLVSLGKMSRIDDLWNLLLEGGTWGTLMSAVLINLIIRVVKTGIEIREEAELTV